MNTVITGASSGIGEALARACAKRGAALYIPSPIFCTDNGAMIAAAAYHKAMEGHFATLHLDVWPGLNLESGLPKLEL